MSVPFDPRPLLEPVSPATARAFRKHLAASAPPMPRAVQRRNVIPLTPQNQEARHV